MAERITIVHLSDFHFKASIEYELCQRIKEGINVVRGDTLKLKDSEQIYFVGSGDLTEHGEQREFLLAHTYLGKQLRFARPDMDAEIGLESPPERTATVPGNHDHWNGKRFNTSNPSLVPTHFRKTPWKKIWPEKPEKPSSLQIELYGLDSNSGLPKRRDVRQGGCIHEDQLKKLDRMLSKSSATHCVRVIILHHDLDQTSLMKFDPTSLIKFDPGALDTNSRNKLLKIAADRKVAVILTGHRHTAKAHTIAMKTKYHEPVWEFRATTCLAGKAGDLNQGFYSYQIELGSGDRITWTWHRYSLDHDRKFIVAETGSFDLQ